MRKNLGLLLSIILCFILVGALVQNYRSQQQTQQQLADMKKQLNSQAAAPAAASAPTVVVQNATTLPTEYAQKQRQILDVMDAGWKLINQRQPAAAQNAADLFQAGLDKIDPTSPDLYNGLGRSLLIAGKSREAIAAWRKGLEYAPKFAEMQSGIGWAYWNLHDPYHARIAWDAAVTLDPKCVDAWSALAWIDLALQHKEPAKEGFKALVDHDTQNRAWNIGLSMARAGNGNLDDIHRFFPLPDLAAFTTEFPDPASAVASTAAAAP